MPVIAGGRYGAVLELDDAHHFLGGCDPAMLLFAIAGIDVSTSTNAGAGLAVSQYKRRTPSIDVPHGNNS